MEVECLQMWQSIVNQAFIDAGTRLTKHNVREMGLARREARAWLLTDVRDFELVCTMAGYEPSIIRRRAQVLASKGWPVYENLRKVRSG